MDVLLTSVLPGTTTSALPIDDGNSEGVFVGKEFAYRLDDVQLDDLQSVVPQNNFSREHVSRLAGKNNWLIEAIEKSLTKRQFKVFELHFIYGYTHEVISQIIGGTRVNVTQNLDKAVKRLRKKLGPTLEPLLMLKKEDQFDV